MFKFNYNVFKSNCNALSKQFNQVRSTCVVYHDLCQESVSKLDPNQSILIENSAPCSDVTNNGTDSTVCSTHNCLEGDHKLMPNHDCQQTSNSSSANHHHHHNHEHGLVYSKRVRSLLLLNALFSPSPTHNRGGGGGGGGGGGRVSPVTTTSASNTSGSSGALSCTWNACTEQIRHYAKKAGKDKKVNKGGKVNKNVPKVQLSDQELESVIDLQQFRSTLDQVVETLRKDLVANINLKMGKNVDQLSVNFDGQHFQLRELAQISRKNANLICLNMAACPDAIKPVLESIRNSGICINPQQEGTTVYLALPKVTKEHRENLSKSAKTLLNRTKDELKSVQNTYMKQARDRKQEKLAEDLIFNACENIKFAVEEAVNTCEEMLEEKLKQLLQ